jgi:hypothetical protein
MRAGAFVPFVAIAVLPRVGIATDVGFKLDARNFTAIEFEEPKREELTGIEIRDRVWAAPGIEEAYGPLEPPRKFDFSAKQRFRIEGRGSLPPQWLDDAAWPRTRELWGLGISNTYYDLRMQFTFGGITLQR